MSSARRRAACIAPAALLLLALRAGAEERPIHIGGGLGAAEFARTDTGFGPAASIHATYELTDMFDIRLELTGSRHEFVEGTTTDFYGAELGLSYKVDVGEWSPYFGLLGGYFAFSNEFVPPPLRQRELGIGVPLGLEYLPLPNLAFALQVSSHGFLSDPMDTVLDAPYITVFARAEYRFGW